MELLATGKASVQAADHQGKQPMHYAKSNGHTDVMELLAIHGGTLEASDGEETDTSFFLLLFGITSAVLVCTPWLFG